MLLLKMKITHMTRFGSTKKYFIKMWDHWIASFIVLLLYRICIDSRLALAGLANNHHSNNSQQLKISPKPCSVSGLEGTCMFVWECIKSEGQHVGMCMDSFMFGSCCSHNLTENYVLPQAQTSTYHNILPTKPIGANSNKNRPSNRPYSSASSSTILRPHGGGQIVIRPPGAHITHQSSFTIAKPTYIATSTEKINSGETFNDLTAAASISAASWTTHSQTTQWQVTTQPNFITKPRPSPWDKTTPSRPKQKPSKKPILSERPGSTLQNTRKPTTSKPKPQIFQPKPTKPQLTSSSQQYTSQSVWSSTAPVTTTTSTTTTTTTTTTLPPPTTTTLSTTVGFSEPASPSIFNLNNGADIQPNSVTLSAARNIECGIPTMHSRPETRIVGGKNAPFGRWPWQVSVRRTSFFGFSSTHRCGGAVLNENWIATAGHCVDDLLTSQIRIRVGEYDFSHVQEQLPYIERAVAKKIVHPKYNFFTYEYDLALVKLDQSLEFAPHIIPICLPGSDDLLIGVNATVTGWGRLSEGGTLPSVLQEVSVPIVSNDRCKTMFLRAGRHEFIPEIFLCAGHETGGQDSCQGDSGGPLQVKSKDGRFFLAGIISWGIGCAEANLPGVCTRISKFVPWILENVVEGNELQQQPQQQPVPQQ